MNRINWIWVAVFGLIVALVFCFGLLALATIFGRWGMIGHGMIGGWWGGFYPWHGGTGHPFGGLLRLLFMGFMMLVPVALLILLILGIVWLVRSLGKTTPPTPTSSCPNCGQPTEPGWRNCPHCGKELG
jgi:hypothetical protein